MVQTILVADDEANIIDVSKRYLEREGYQVLAASDSNEAIDIWRKENPDFVVLDLMMPEKDGWQVCEEIRNLKTIRLETTRLNDLIDDLFQLSQLDSDTKPFHTEPYHLDHLILETLENQYVQLKKTNLM